MAILDGALPKPIIPVLRPCACVRSAHLAHGIKKMSLSLPLLSSFTSRFRGKRSTRLSARLFRRVQISCGRNEQGYGNVMVSYWRQLSGEKIVAVSCVGLDCRNFGSTLASFKCSRVLQSAHGGLVPVHFSAVHPAARARFVTREST
jgi:hypothetical protein